MTPTQRTLAYLKERGITAGVVERWIPRAKVRKDLFGIIDIIGIYKYSIVGIQSCSGSGFSKHDKKIMVSDNTRKWLETGAELWLVGWRKVKKKRGGKQMVWKSRVKEYKLEDFG